MVKFIVVLIVCVISGRLTASMLDNFEKGKNWRAIIDTAELLGFAYLCTKIIF